MNLINDENNFSMILWFETHKLDLCFQIFLLYNFHWNGFQLLFPDKEEKCYAQYTGTLWHNWDVLCVSGNFATSHHCRKFDLTKEDKTQSRKILLNIIKVGTLKNQMRVTKRPLGSTKGTFEAFSFINAPGSTCCRKVWKRSKRHQSISTLLVPYKNKNMFIYPTNCSVPAAVCIKK